MREKLLTVSAGNLQLLSGIYLIITKTLLTAKAVKKNHYYYLLFSSLHTYINYGCKNSSDFLHLFRNTIPTYRTIFSQPS